MPKRGSNKTQKQATTNGPEPSPRDFEIYRELCKGRTLRDVGDEFELDHSVIWRIREKIEKYLSPRFQKQISRIKVRQTTSLEHIFSEAMAAWEKSKEPTVEVTDTVTDEGDIHSVKRKSTSGQPAHLNQARGALADIRAIWTIEKHYEQEGIDALNPAGMERDEYRRKVAEAKIAELQGLVSELQTEGAACEAGATDE